LGLLDSRLRGFDKSQQFQTFYGFIIFNVVGVEKTQQIAEAGMGLLMPPELQINGQTFGGNSL
jgi:hypothetical protein